MQRGRPDPQLVGGQHRLVVLLLVLHDHAEREPVGDQPAPLQGYRVEQVEHLVADGPHVPARLGRTEQRQCRPVPARVAERVVQVVDVLPYRFTATHVAHQPQLLLVADVREVPHQRGHQRRMLADQVVVVDRVGQHGAAGTGALQFGRHAGAQPVNGFGHVDLLAVVVAVSASRSSTACRRSGARSVRCSASAASSKTSRAARASTGSASPSRAADVHRPAAGPASSRAVSTVDSSANSAASTATGTVQPSPGWVSR